MPVGTERGELEQTLSSVEETLAQIHKSLDRLLPQDSVELVPPCGNGIFAAAIRIQGDAERAHDRIVTIANKVGPL